MVDLISSFSILTSEGVLLYILKGVAFTLIISVISVTFGVVFGSVLALVRNYCNHNIARVFKWISIAYIELFRNTPLLLWLFICLVFCPVPESFTHKMFGLTSVEAKILFRSAVALILFTSSVIAEIVRGGLNSIDDGQFEAGYSQGFSSVQVMWHIALPQAFRAIVPTLLGQIITTIKDSSYIANVAVIELMSRVRKILSISGMYNGIEKQLVSDVFVLFGFAFFIYFVINFTLSCLVRYSQKRRERVSSFSRFAT